ncbi:hypothetical protein PR202_ga04489 [Eleusine coracana subsp. coracana]|uniref:Uncharacterized protein n=1 Tax=Eleusine coracana subsp. coracana TaxID=191504 RepID=A0AAV5BRQ8_ELECO|nr:hypothetical protein PR202_ga04489 [Eleusine coracana subsp. coracana]
MAAKQPSEIERQRRRRRIWPAFLSRKKAPKLLVGAGAAQERPACEEAVLFLKYKDMMSDPVKVSEEAC